MMKRPKRTSSYLANPRNLSSKTFSTSGYLKSTTHSYGEDWETEIRPSILERDNYTCSHCGLKLNKKFARYLHVHHKLKYAKFKSHNKDILETLCVDCHSSEHGKSLGSIPDKVKRIFKK